MKSVLITGCSSGIGLCLAKGLKQKGYQVFATARGDIDVEKLKNLGLDAYQLDLSSSVSIQRAMSHVYEHYSNFLAVVITIKSKISE
ncbi:SDR family NAD(P)-dependent oxidoreductase [Isorropodon fossajaponicum symbiont]|uniref:SDR family NAD(P)-dependent oxidoreductase n=1 Tax=Isorropodon fossajaponicum symbiont TaxID=883811 RepID=UPI001916A118